MFIYAKLYKFVECQLFVDISFQYLSELVKIQKFEWMTARASKIPSKPSGEVALWQNHRISYPPQSRKIGFEDGQGKTHKTRIEKRERKRHEVTVLETLGAFCLSFWGHVTLCFKQMLKFCDLRQNDWNSKSISYICFLVRGINEIVLYMVFHLSMSSCVLWRLRSKRMHLSSAWNLKGRVFWY